MLHTLKRCELSKELKFRVTKCQFDDFSSSFTVHFPAIFFVERTRKVIWRIWHGVQPALNMAFSNFRKFFAPDLVYPSSKIYVVLLTPSGLLEAHNVNHIVADFIPVASFFPEAQSDKF